MMCVVFLDCPTCPGEGRHRPCHAAVATISALHKGPDPVCSAVRGVCHSSVNSEFDAIFTLKFDYKFYNPSHLPPCLSVFSHHIFLFTGPGPPLGGTDFSPVVSLKRAVGSRKCL